MEIQRKVEDAYIGRSLWHSTEKFLDQGADIGEEDEDELDAVLFG